MFEAVAAIGGLDVQLVYYQWRRRMRRLALAERRSSAHLDHVSGSCVRSGHTQIAQGAGARGKGTQAASRSTRSSWSAMPARKRRVGRSAPRLASSKRRRPSVFQEGDDPDVTRVYSELARLTGGAVASFDVSAGQRLADLLKAVAAFATGGVMALAAQETDAAMLLLGQIKRGGKT